MPKPQAKGDGQRRQPVPRHAAQKMHEPLSYAPSKLTYALRAWTAERHSDGWYVTPTISSVVGNKPEWKGPFQSIENACLAIARGLAVELADRHTRHVEHFNIAKGAALYGLKPDTHL